MTTTTTRIKVVDELPPLDALPLWAVRANAMLVDDPLKLMGSLNPSYPSLVILKEYCPVVTFAKIT
jgi:hypothetical protein